MLRNKGAGGGGEGGNPTLHVGGAAPPNCTLRHLPRERIEPPLRRIADGQLVALKVTRSDAIDEPRVTREIEALDYEAYAEMAHARIEQILRACVAKHGLWAAAAEHRTGRVELGEARVIVARLRAITSQVVPSDVPYRNPADRELFLSGLRLAMGDAA